MTRKRLGADLQAILSATDPEGTFDAARALGERGPDALPPLLECLHELAGGTREAPVWGVASALYWVVQGYLEAVAGGRVVLEERPLTDAVNGLALALARLGAGMESAAIKVGTILGDEIPRTSGEYMEGDIALPMRVRLLERCRLALEGALGTSSAATIGALTGLSQLATYVGAAMVRSAVEKAGRNPADPKVAEVARWAMAMLEDEA